MYSGENGRFDLYEDDGRTLEYQSGKYSVIPITWNDDEQVLELGDKQGSYGGNTKKFIVRLVHEGIVRDVCYEGKKMRLSLK